MKQVSKQKTKKKSAESVFSCVTNISDTGTYEIDICERESPDSSSCSDSVTYPRSNILSESSDESKYRRYSKRMEPVEYSKSDQTIVTGKPSTRSKHVQISMEPIDKPGNLVLLNKETSTNEENLTSKSHASISSSASENGDASFSTTDFTNSNCCSSDFTTSDSENTYDKNRLGSSSHSSLSSKKSTSSICNVTDNSCDYNTYVNSQRESSGTYTILSDDKNSKDSENENCMEKTPQTCTVIQALEFIREEKDEEWAEGYRTFKTCACEVNGYEERLSALEKCHFSCKTVEDDDKTESGTVFNHSSCDYAITSNQFAEIKDRIEALEKLCMDSFGKKPESSKEIIPVTYHLEPVTDEKKSFNPEEVKENNELKTLSGTLDGATLTAIELAKIKQRLMDLENKINNDKLYSNFSFSSLKYSVSDKSVGVNIKTRNASSLLNKETQTVDSDENQESSVSEEESEITAQNKLATFYMTKKDETWDKVLRDEAIQTPSKKQIDQWSADSELYGKFKEKKKKSKKLCNRIHICKECDDYITQKIGRRRRSSFENPRKNKKLDGNFQRKKKKFGSKNIKFKKSFDIYDVNNLDYIWRRESKILSFLDSRKGLLEKKPKKGDRKLKLCSKSSKTNLKEEDIFDNESELESSRKKISRKGVEKKTDSIECWNKNLRRDSGASFDNIRIPNRSFQIYHTHGINIFQHPSRTKEFEYDCSRKLKPLEDRNSSRIGSLSVAPTDQTKILFTHRPYEGFPDYEYGDNNFSLTKNSVNDSINNYSNFLQAKDDSSPFKTMEPGRKIKIPVLFEEMCSSKLDRSKTFGQQSSMSMKIVNVEVTKEEKTCVNPLKKLVRKFSHYQSQSQKNFIPFGISKCCCGNNTKKNKATFGSYKNSNVPVSRRKKFRQ